ncbi:MAG: (2Fe-2S)-binding protein [Eubacteriales bacterium]|nr:(2Fe-2S)-binding protein [Eubacteriales bacterium]
MEMDKIVCYCMNVTNGMIKDAVESGASTLEEVQAITYAGTVCGTCLENVQHLVDHFVRERDHSS